MGKKRLREGDGNGARPADRPDADQEGDEEDFDMVDVEFEWFNFDPQVDFHGVKALLRQLLDVDSSLFNLSALADLVLSQPTIGSTVKVDGKDNDPYAMLTVLNTLEHGEREPMRGLVKYLAEKAQSNDRLSMIPKLLQGGNQVGLLLAERLINVPAEIGPPMYSMLLDEVEAAVEDKEPYQFSHYLILSKTYREMESSLHDSGDRKRKKAREESSLYYFHPEDEILQKYALAYGGFDYTKEGDAVADSKRAFQEMGIKASGHMILIEAGSRFEEAVKAVNEYLRPAQ